MIIITRTSHSTNFVSIWRNSLKNQKESVSIWRSDKSCTSTTSSSLTRICSWSNVFKSYVLISMTFKKNWTLIITTRIKYEKFSFEHAKIIRFYWSIYIIHRRSFQISSTLFITILSITNQSTKRITRIFKASTSSIVIMLMITISSTNNIIANWTIIVTIVDFLLILDLAIDFQFVRLKSVSYVINLSVDQQITRKRNAMTSKSALRIEISNENCVRDLNVVWNNLSLSSKIIKMRISSFNSSKSWISTSTFRSIIFRLMNSSLNSTANQNHFSSLSTRLITRKQFLQSLSCSLTRHLRTN
jgi:hypothetical protein